MASGLVDADAGRWIDAYLKDQARRRRLTRRSARVYRRDIEGFNAYLASQGVTLGEARRLDARKYLGVLRDERNRAASSCARTARVIRQFFRWCDRVGAFTLVEPMGQRVSRLRIPRRGRRLPRTVSTTEIERVLGAMYTKLADGGLTRRQSARAVRDVAMVELLYASGMRNSELTGLRTSHVDLGLREARVTGKGGVDRICFFGAPAALAVRDWLDHGRPVFRPGTDDGPLFVNDTGDAVSSRLLQRVVRQAAEISELGRVVTPHVFRHAFATHLVDQGADIRAVQLMLGHEQIGTTEIYTAVSTARLFRVVPGALKHVRVVETREARRVRGDAGAFRSRARPRPRRRSRGRAAAGGAGAR